MFTCVVDEGSQDRIELLAISATLRFQRFPKRKKNYPQSIYSKMTGPMVKCLTGMQHPFYAVRSFHECLAELKNHMGELPDSHFALWHGKLILILIYVLRRSSIDFLVRSRFPWSIFLDFISAYSIDTIPGFVLDEITHVLSEYLSINYDREVSVEDPVYPKLYEVFTKYSVSRPQNIKLDRALRLSLWRHGLHSSGILNLPSSKMTSSELLDWWVSYSGGPLSRLVNPSPSLLRPLYVEYGNDRHVERCDGILCLLSAVEAAMKEHLIPMTPSYLLSTETIQESDVAPLRAYARLLATRLALGLKTEDKYDGDVIHRLFYENLLQEDTRLHYMARLLQPTFLFADLNAHIIAPMKAVRHSLIPCPDKMLHILLAAAVILILNLLFMMTPSRNIQ